MKNIKISDEAHKKLKVFAANVEYNINVVASIAVIRYVESQKSKKDKKSKSVS